MKTKTKTKCKRLLAVFLVIALCYFPSPVQAQDIAIPSTSESIVISDSLIGYSPSELPENIQHLLPETTSASRVYLTSDDTRTASGNNEEDLYTLRVEDPVTGEGSIKTFATPVKYVDQTGKVQFIDTSMKSVNRSNSIYSYQNAANAFTVKYGNTPHVGLTMDDAFTLSINTPASATKTTTEKAENGAGKIVY